MKKIKNRIISLLLAMAMAASAGINGVWAAELVQSQESDVTIAAADSSDEAESSAPAVAQTDEQEGDQSQKGEESGEGEPEERDIPEDDKGSETDSDAQEDDKGPETDSDAQEDDKGPETDSDAQEDNKSQETDSSVQEPEESRETGRDNEAEEESEAEPPQSQEENAPALEENTVPEAAAEKTETPRESENLTVQESAQQQSEETGSEQQEDEETEESEAKLNVAEKKTLSVEYDDRFTFSAVKSGYVVAAVTSEKASSYVVTKGKVTSSRDKRVLTLKGEKAVATGTGEATVLMVKKSDLAAAKALLNKDENATQSVDAVQVDVTVSPAPLTLMFLAGQSNMEGYGAYPGSGKKSAAKYQHPEQSIVCPEGEVYSTYAPSESAYKTKRANSLGGNVKFKGWCEKKLVEGYVAGSLTSNKNYYDKKLVYPINQLTSAGKGKSGPDSGLAYEWNRLTGDKVWTVNAAWGGSISSRWTPGKDCYNRALAVYKLALKTYNAEIKAGHYKKSQKLYFWLQGENDGTHDISIGKYLNNFKLMRKYMKKNLGFSQIGIISVRASKGGHFKDARDVAMTGARLAQTYMSNTKAYSDVHIVSDVNEQWVSDAKVKKYFKNAYGGAFSYKTHGKKPALPTKVSQVHNDIHFLQAAHNENGLTAARGMYQILAGKTEAKGVRWRTENGKDIKTLNLGVGKTIIFSPTVHWVSAAKQVYWRFSSGLTYSARNAKLKRTKASAQKIEAVSGGKVISTLTIPAANGINAPVLKSVANVKGKKMQVKWAKSAKATGYQVQYSLNADFSGGKVVKVKKAKSVSATVKGLKAKKTYYVRVRAVSGSKVSGWSDVKQVVIKK